ncbi:MAG: hypothetical protein NVS9B14_22080 [Candidatus Acidiferrum sp.]
MGTRKVEEVDAKRLWKQLEDVVVPRLAMSVIDRAVYSHLLRHSHLEGRRQVKFSIAWLGRGARLSHGPTRQSVRRLLERGVLRLVTRSHGGHTVEVHLPEEIRAVQNAEAAEQSAADAKLEATDFLKTKEMRQAIHAREEGFCFYCLRRLEEEEEKTLDHVVPQVDGGGNSYRNLVSSCADCNCYKSRQPAGDYLRRLYREGRLTAAELSERLQALDALAAGSLRPRMEKPEDPRSGEETAESING